MRIIEGRAGMPSENRGGGTFSGEVWSDAVLPTADDGATVNAVVFLPGSRTYWHAHDGGQLLQITQGKGLVCSEGAPPVVVRPGDTIWAPGGERHWHGACVDSLMAHTAVSLGSTTWEDMVADEDYTAPAVDGRR